MKSDNERVEQFLKDIVLPEYRSDGHARQLRAQILSRVQASRAGRENRPWWKTAALLLVLLGAGALATETIIQVHHYYFAGKLTDDLYVFSTAPKEAWTNHGSSDMALVAVWGDLDAAGIEQKRKDLEEVETLRQRNARELVGVSDMEVNGHPMAGTFCYEYVLVDGRTERVNGRGDESESDRDREQIADLRKRGEREILNVVEVEFRGQVQRTLSCRYVLSDGRIVIRSEKDPELPGPVPLTNEQRTELSQLAFLEKGQFLGSAQVQVHGRPVSLRKYSFTLSDGTVLTRSEGQPEGSKKRDLTLAEADEFRQLAAAHKGETLATYEEDVKGKPFKFTRVKYVLSDGTEVIQSSGKPSGER